MTACWGCGWPHEPGRLHDAVWLAEGDPDYAASLPDDVVAALAEWSAGNGTGTTIRAEAARRRDKYAALSSRFAEAARSRP
jgi:hypothetical protein